MKDITITVLSEAKTSILYNLAKYRFNTVKQFQRLGVSSQVAHISKTLKVLRETNLIDRTGFAFTAKIGKMPDLYFLTPKGAKVVAESQRVDIESIQYPKSSNTLFQHDYLHRITTIDLQIAFDVWANGTFEVEPLFFDTYYHKVGSQRNQEETGKLRAKTQIELSDGSHFTPDAICRFTQKGKDTICCIEVHNGQDTTRLSNTIKGHLKAISDNAVQRAYDYKRLNYVLIVCERKEVMRKVIERINENIDLSNKVDKFLLFKTTDQIEPFADNWLTVSGSIVSVQ